MVTDMIVVPKAPPVVYTPPVIIEVPLVETVTIEQIDEGQVLEIIDPNKSNYLFFVLGLALLLLLPAVADALFFGLFFILYGIAFTFTCYAMLSITGAQK